MRTILTAALVLALATPAFAATPPVDPTKDHLTLPIHLRSTATPAPWFTSGVVAGRFGGIPVVGNFTGTSAIGLLTLTTHGATFAYGGYACLQKSCTFTGMLAGVRVKGLPIPLNIGGSGRAAASAFPTRRSWIAAVTTWAKQHLTGNHRDSVIAEAIKIQGS